MTKTRKRAAQLKDDHHERNNEDGEEGNSLRK